MILSYLNSFTVFSFLPFSFPPSYPFSPLSPSCLPTPLLSFFLAYSLPFFLTYSLLPCLLLSFFLAYSLPLLLPCLLSSSLSFLPPPTHRSFGVSLWEVVSFAQWPYDEMSNEEVIQMVIGTGKCCLEDPLTPTDPIAYL